MQAPASSFGSLLRHHRVALGWTQERLAEEAGLSVEGVSALERGKSRAPRAETVALLADALRLEGASRSALEQAATAARLAREKETAGIEPDREVLPAQVGEVTEPPMPGRRAARAAKMAAWLAVPLVLVLAVLLLRDGLRSQTHSTGSRPAGRELLHLQAIWKPPALQPFALREPRAVALEPDGTLVVADYARATLLRVSPSGRLLGQWGGPGVAAGQFLRPTDVAVDKKGDVYVADTGNNRVQELSAQGKPLRQWSAQADLGRSLFQPQGVAVDGTGGIYIADTGNRRLIKLGSDGEVLWQRHQTAEAVALDSSGNVLVLAAGEFGQPRPLITVLSSNGDVRDHLRSYWVGPLSPTHGQWFEWHVATTAHGRIYATNGTSDAVWLFARTRYASAPSLPGVSAPAGLTGNARGEMYVTDVAAGTLVRVGLDGRMAGRWHVLRPLITPFRSPAGIAADRGGHVYVADTGNNRVVELSKTGEVQRVWDRRSGRAMFDRPAGLATDPHGRVFVADSGHNAIDILSPPSNSVLRWTGSLRSPSACSVGRGGIVYVADKTSVTAFSSSGRTINRVVAGVTGLAADARGPIVLAAHLPSVSTISRTGHTQAVFSVVHGTIDAVAMGPRGTIFALDSSAGKLYVMAPGGNVIQTLGGPRNKTGDLSSPRALAVGADGRVYVADTGNNRVVVFAPST